MSFAFLQLSAIQTSSSPSASSTAGFCGNCVPALIPTSSKNSWFYVKNGIMTDGSGWQSVACLWALSRGAAWPPWHRCCQECSMHEISESSDFSRVPGAGFYKAIPCCTCTMVMFYSVNKRPSTSLLLFFYGQITSAYVTETHPCIQRAKRKTFTCLTFFSFCVASFQK